jgi:hypothetical protein
MATRPALISEPKVEPVPAVKRNCSLRPWLEGNLEKGKHKIFSERIRVTPDLACVILEEHNKDNRKIYPVKLDQLKSDLNSGRFKLNGESIIFAKTGELNDGQHRLTAVLETGRSAEMIFVFGVERDSRETVDVGKARTPGDFLGMKGVAYASQVGALAKKVVGFERTDRHTLGRTNGISTSQVLGRVKGDDLLVECAAWAVNNAAFYRHMILSGELAFCYYEFASKNPIKAKGFMEQFKEGLNLKVGDPIYTVRQYLISRPRLTPPMRIEAMIRAWNQWISDSQLERIRIIGILPTIEG